ncbi:MAG: transcriptional regulator [Actinobacteria bacterium]|nr:MAG: transcriptional regulator [Actinomycetota bacterium]
MTHPVNRIDDTVHQRVRLGILALLSPVKSADFTFVRDEMGLTDGNLSRHVQVLEEAGFLSVNKGFEGRKPRTWVSITKDGRAALQREVAALRDLIAGMST